MPMSNSPITKPMPNTHPNAPAMPPKDMPMQRMPKPMPSTKTMPHPSKMPK